MEVEGDETIEGFRSRKKKKKGGNFSIQRKKNVEEIFSVCHFFPDVGILHQSLNVKPWNRSQQILDILIRKWCRERLAYFFIFLLSSSPSESCLGYSYAGKK